MLSEVLSELYYKEGSVIRKRILNNGTWTLQLSIASGKNIPSWVVVGFVKSDKFDEKSPHDSVFDWLPVSSAVCGLGSDRYIT